MHWGRRCLLSPVSRALAGGATAEFAAFARRPRPEIFRGQRAHQARVADGSHCLLRRDAADGQRVVVLREIELLELPVALCGRTMHKASGAAGHI